MSNIVETQEVIQLRPVRVIPVDFGYRIDNKKKNIICETLKSFGYILTDVVRLFGEDAILSVKCQDDLTMYLFWILPCPIL